MRSSSQQSTSSPEDPITGNRQKKPQPNLAKAKEVTSSSITKTENNSLTNTHNDTHTSYQHQGDRNKCWKIAREIATSNAVHRHRFNAHPQQNTQNITHITCQNKNSSHAAQGINIQEQAQPNLHAINAKQSAPLVIKVEDISSLNTCTDTDTADQKTDPSNQREISHRKATLVIKAENSSPLNSYNDTFTSNKNNDLLNKRESNRKKFVKGKQNTIPTAISNSQETKRNTIKEEPLISQETHTRSLNSQKTERRIKDEPRSLSTTPNFPFLLPWVDENVVRTRLENGERMYIKSELKVLAKAKRVKQWMNSGRIYKQKLESKGGYTEVCNQFTIILKSSFFPNFYRGKRGKSSNSHDFPGFRILPFSLFTELYIYSQI